ncbi:MAG: PepSY domain-containing protein, partial [Reyranella sp.]
MRHAFTLVHRWIGLAIAAFLFLSGLTGAVISWDHELDDLLNAHLHEAVANGPAMASLDLARQVEARDARVRVTYVPLAAEPGESLSFSVQPRVDPATGRLYEPGYNQVFLDPSSGTVLGRRQWGQAWPITSETFVSFLYKLHYSLHIPEMWGIDRWGLWLLGVVAAIWAVDCFIGFYLTLPVRHPSHPDRPAGVVRALKRGWWARWKPAWRIKTSGSAYRINFDVHRAFGLWTWLLL